MIAEQFGGGGQRWGWFSLHICEAWHYPVKCSRLGLKSLMLENCRNYASCPVLHLTSRHVK